MFNQPARPEINQPAIHAEVLVLQKIEQKIEQHVENAASNGKKSQIEMYMYMNYSPCAPCAALLTAFANEYPKFNVYIRFIKLYMCGSHIQNKIGTANQLGLQNLISCPNVNVNVLTHANYKNLFNVPYMKRARGPIDKNTVNELKVIKNNV